MRWNPRRLAGATAAALAGLGLVLAAPAGAGDQTALQMKRYQNATWHFALDVPAPWHAFPPGPAFNSDDVSSPYEVVRFSEKGDRTLMSVYRMPHDPSAGLTLAAKQIQATLTKDGCSNFATGEARIGPRRVLTLDCVKRHPGGQSWRVRAYLIVDGTLMYVLGFGATDRATLAGAYDRMAKSFTFEEAASG